MTYIQRKVAEFKEIQKESYMTATPKPLLLQPEAVAWYEQVLIETIAQAIAEDRERVRGEIYKKRKNILWEKHNRLDINLDESKGYNQALDDILSSLDKPLTDKNI